MATSSRPRRSVNRRSMEYHEGLLHEEELAIRRALQASLIVSRAKTTEPHKNGTSLHQENSINAKREHRNLSSKKHLPDNKHENKCKHNHLSDDKHENSRKARPKRRLDVDGKRDFQPTNVKKKPKITNNNSSSSRSRSSSVNSSDSTNSSSSNSKILTSASSQTKVKCTKILKSPAKSPKKEKLGVKIRKKLMKKKLKDAKHGSDCESTMSGSTASEIVTLKKARKMKKRKRNPQAFVQKKFASVTPSPTKMSVSTVEFDATTPLAKAEDFIDFLCLRGHPQMPKDLELFNSPYDSPFCEEDFPTSPPSSSLSELPSSPSPSLPTATSTDSPSCETPTFDPLVECDDGMHAMRMYAGIENKRKALDEQSSKQEITIADLEQEEEPFKNVKSLTPPMSFHISPRPVPPMKNQKSPKISPSPAPLMTNSPSTSKKDVLYPTPDSPSFGPPPLMLGQAKGSGKGDCCSPPPLLYIPAAAQRVTHLHGPPKLERVYPTSDGIMSANSGPPHLKRHDHYLAGNSQEHDYVKNNTRTSDGLPGNFRMQPLDYTRPSSAVDLTEATSTKAKDTGSSVEEFKGLNGSYTRNTKSCPLRNASDMFRLEQAKKNLNAHTCNSLFSGSPTTRPSSQGASSISSHVGYNTRCHEACSEFNQGGKNSSIVGKNSLSNLEGFESPESTVSLGANSLIENLQRAHDNVSGLMSPPGNSPVLNGTNKLMPSPQKLCYTHSGNCAISQESFQMNCSSYPSLLRDNHKIPSYPRIPPVSEPFTGQETGNILPFEPTNRESIGSPWSHLHASYDKSSNPPRPYTLSINSTYNPCSQNHVVPRTIPLVPKVPIIPSNKHISVPFNEEFLHKPGFSQDYSIPCGFVGASQNSNGQLGGNLTAYQRKTPQSKDIALGYNSSFSLKLTESNSLGNSMKIPHELSRSCGENNTVVLNGKVCRENSSSCKDEKLEAKAKSGLPSDSRGDSSKELKNLQNDIKPNQEIKKRRGRPPGSKNKKTVDKDRKETPKKNVSVTTESTERKECDATKPSMKKKIGCPILRPTEEEFKDPIVYLKSIQSSLEKFGICVIDPPDSWKMESHLPGNPRFTTKRQLIHRLQKRWGPTEIKLACIEKHLQQQQSTFNLSQLPVVGGCDLDLVEVSRIVMEHGGMQKIIDTKKWNKVADLLKIPKSTQDRVGKVQDAYCKYLLSFDLLAESEKSMLESEVKKEIDQKGDCEEYRSQCSMRGRSFSMGCFQRTARNFQDHFFKTDPSVNDIEREYWKNVQTRDKYIAAHHAKLDTKEHGSCFPTNKSDPYSKNGWNLNILAHLKGSILRNAGNVEDLTIPWLNIDMLFSTKRWTTSPLQTYMIDYLHSSNDKVWYGVPEADMNSFPHTLQENTNDYEDGEFMVSPSNLSRETGLNVTRLEQKQGQFVVVSPKVFHCSVSTGYSVSETVCFAFPEWLSRSSTIDSDVFLNWPGFSYEKLLLKSIDEVCSSGKKNTECLLSELQQIRETEVKLRKELKELGVTDSKPTTTTGKGIQTIITVEGSIQVNGNSMSCVVCDRLCYLSTVLSEKDSEIICLSDAINYIKKEETSKSFTVVTNFSVSKLDEAISSVSKKLSSL